MRWSGLLLVVAGIWVTAQVTRGNALGRLGISGSASPAGGGSSSSSSGAPDPLPPVPDRGYAGVPHDAHGYPL